MIKYVNVRYLVIAFIAARVQEPNHFIDVNKMACRGKRSFDAIIVGSIQRSKKMPKYSINEKPDKPRPNVEPVGQLPKVKNIPPSPPYGPARSKQNSIEGIPIKDLRTLLYDKIFGDEGMKLGYVANVAMLLFDSLEDERLNDTNFRDELAIKILNLILKS